MPFLLFAFTMWSIRTLLAVLFIPLCLSSILPSTGQPFVEDEDEDRNVSQVRSEPLYKPNFLKSAGSKDRQKKFFHVEREGEWVSLMILPVFLEGELKTLLSPEQITELKKMTWESIRFFSKAIKTRAASFDIVDICGRKGDFSRHYHGLWEDVVMLVTAKTCTTSSQLADAHYCGLATDASNKGRPISGILNICVQRFINLKPEEYKMWIATMKHELIHALVFHSGLFNSYRTRSGAPHSPPPVQNLTRNWKTSTGVVVHKIQAMVTPNVVAKAREHFNCPTLNGVELEDQGGKGTAGTHWKKRLYEHELMGGFSTSFYALSSLTLALFDDSGWYMANYSYAEPMTYGKNKGCLFAEDSCLAWMQSGRGPAPFCKNPTDRSCSDDHRMKVTCNHDANARPSARDYIYVDAPNGPTVYGRDVMDYCPFFMKYTQGEDGADSVCDVTRDANPDDFSLQIHSPYSRCFHLKTPITFKSGLNKQTMKTEIGCYEHKCDQGKLWIKVANSKYYPCNYKGQLIHIQKTIFAKGETSFDIICPDCSKICSNCTYDTDRKSRYIGDTPVTRNSSGSLLTTCLLLIALIINK